MEMVSTTYRNHLPALIEEGAICITQIDAMVSKILHLKFELGLFSNPYIEADKLPSLVCDEHLAVAKEAATKSCVLLKNDFQILPLDANNIESLAIIGPMADDGYEQLGTWIFDGEAKHSITCLQAIQDAVGDTVKLQYAKAMDTSRSMDDAGFAEAVQIAKSSAAAIMFLGEESILSGEAHCRSEINLPGCQEQLITAIAATGTPIILVVMAGRPLTIEKILPKVDAILYAWHPGTMGGPAIADLLFGQHSPSGKLPVTFPRTVGQIPLYYGQKNTGKPATNDSYVHMNDIPIRAAQTSLGMSATHLDTHFSPLFSFGYGLSYTTFSYQNIRVNKHSIGLNDSLEVSAELSNIGHVDADEVVQLYVRDLVGNVTRPIKELKGFKRVHIGAGQSETITFTINSSDLAFYDRKMQLRAEAGQFHVWIGGSSETELRAEFEIHDSAN